MVREEDVIYHRDLSGEELLKEKKKTEETHVKSHVNKGAFAGFMLFMAISKLMGAPTLVAAIFGGIGAGIGCLIGYLEALHREKKLKARNDNDKVFKGSNAKES